MKQAFILAFSAIILFDIANAQKITILTNHLGYEAIGPKHAVVESKPSDQVQSFTIINYITGNKVYSGQVVKSGPVNKWKDWYFWTIDFDSVQQEGTYYIECITDKGAVQSFPFKVQKDLLERNTLSNVVAYFKGQRSSGLLDKADYKLTLEGTTQTADVHGGWFDATGDYGKHLSHLSFSTYFNPQQIPLVVWSLFKTYEALDKRNDSNFLQYKRRLLDEAMFGADYLVRVKTPKGSFYRSVSAPGPGKRAEDRIIAKDSRGFTIKTVETKNSFVMGEINKISSQATYEVSYRSGGGLAIAGLAIAARYPVSGDFTSNDYLRAAEQAFAFLEKNNVTYTNDGKENIVDDYCALMAASELYKTTKKPEYKQAADKRANNLVKRLVTSGAYQNYWRANDTDRPFFHAVDAGMPVVSLVNYLDIADHATQTKVLEAIKKYLQFELQITNEINNPFGYARQYVQNKDGVRRNSFFYPHDAETAPWWQGENARLASIATAARMASPYFKDDPSFYHQLQVHAWNQLNWILGLNPFDSCMLYGTGRNNITYMFFNSYQYTNVPGGISNGITGGYNDPDDIDYDLGFAKTGKDEDWRWGEQWLPHAAWYLMAIALR